MVNSRVTGQRKTPGGRVVNQPACPGQRHRAHHGADGVQPAQSAIAESKSLPEFLTVKRNKVGLSKARHGHQDRAKNQMAAVLKHKTK